LKCPENSLGTFWSRNEDTNSSITRFAVSLEESDEEKANRKREKVIENWVRRNRKCFKKRKEERKRQKISKKAAEEGTAHIGKVLEYQSETGRSWSEASGARSKEGGAR
jgi:hypothetical protein